MNSSETDKSNTETLEYLLGIVVENRDRRCTEIRKAARIQAKDIIKQAHTRVRARLHHHVTMLREKYIDRTSAAQARKQTLIRQQQQLANRDILNAAWPVLCESLRVLWNAPVTKQQWLEAAVSIASAKLLGRGWRIEHPADFGAEEQARLKHYLINIGEKTAELSIADDIEAGIRIIANETVIDATLEGILQQRSVIEAMIIARIKQDEFGHD